MHPRLMSRLSVLLLKVYTRVKIPELGQQIISVEVSAQVGDLLTAHSAKRTTYLTGVEVTLVRPNFHKKLGFSLGRILQDLGPAIIIVLS